MDLLKRSDMVDERNMTGEKGVVQVDNSRPRPGGRLAAYIMSHFGSVAVAIILLLLVVVGIVVGVVVGKKDEETPPTETPVAVDYSTGVSLAACCGIDSVIGSRLAKTKVTMEVANALDCSSIHSITLQLPLATRVASLKTISEGCVTNGDVQKLEDARETFLETAARGLPGAYIEEQDSFTHSLQVAIPPLGKTRVELVLEELLQQRLGEVEFQIPLLPNEAVDQVVLDVTVEDIDQGPADFYLDLGNDFVVNANSSFHLDLPDAREHALARLLRGRYSPGDIPDSGILYTEGKCFEHFFRPDSLEPMRRNLVFLLDTSRSMRRDGKFNSAKTALKSFIDTLTPEDTFTIQTFSNRGTTALWGSAQATDVEKADARHFIDNLGDLDSPYTDLHEALLEGLLRAKRDADGSSDDTVTILLLLSGGWATAGETNRRKIAANVYKLNQEGKVKIYSLGFQDEADMELLSAIAIMNGGIAAPILQSSVNFATQIESFLESQFGAVILSDVKVTLGGGMEIYGETQQTFPLLADGYEVVVRGLLGESGPSDSLYAVTAANTRAGGDEWSTIALKVPSTSEGKHSRCFQSYAHARITQLQHLREAVKLIGDDIMAKHLSLSKPCPSDVDLADCIKEEALSVALEAKVVAQGLTGMVTVDEDKCLSFEGVTEICLDGTTPDGDHPEYSSNSPFGGESRFPSCSLPKLTFTIFCVWIGLMMFFS